MRHYVIISGTGRAGSTLLVRVLTRAGVDTGFSVDSPVDPISFGGLELELRDKPSAYVVKSPWIALYIEQLLAEDEIAIDHAIICTRDLRAAAESRRRVQAADGGSRDVPGGLWMTDDPDQQERVLAALFSRLIFHLSAHDVPMTFLQFPRFALEPTYLIEKLGQVFPSVSADEFLAAFRAESRPELIHDFS
jgi:hypothetical protein